MYRLWIKVFFVLLQTCLFVRNAFSTKNQNNKTDNIFFVELLMSILPLMTWFWDDAHWPNLPIALLSAVQIKEKTQHTQQNNCHLNLLHSPERTRDGRRRHSLSLSLRCVDPRPGVDGVPVQQQSERHPGWRDGSRQNHPNHRSHHLPDGTQETERPLPHHRPAVVSITRLLLPHLQSCALNEKEKKKHSVCASVCMCLAVEMTSTEPHWIRVGLYSHCKSAVKIAGRGLLFPGMTANYVGPKTSKSTTTTIQLWVFFKFICIKSFVFLVFQN